MIRNRLFPLLAKGTRKAAENRLIIAVPGGELAVSIRRLPQARRLTLRVRAGERDAVLTMPNHVTLSQAQRFAERNAEWLGKRLSALPERVPFAPGRLVPLRGVDHVLEHRPAARGVAWIEASASAGVPVRETPLPRLVVAGHTEHFARRVGDFLKREARGDLEAAVERFASALGVTTTKLRLGDPVSRWGSCSSRGGLSFSWRLVMAPPLVLDYLAAHEVAHRREMNHGPKFWATVERLFPQFEEAERWIRLQGAGLHRYGAAEPASAGKLDED